MERDNEVSVVIPIYGDFDVRRILICIESIKLQQGVDVEIVVSEQGVKRRFPDVQGVKHIFTYHESQEAVSDFNPGNVRNIAIVNSTKKYIYTIDADIVILDPLFLKKSINAIKNNSQKVLYRPFMRRLPLDNFEEFNEWFNSIGLKDALKKLFFNQDFLVKTNPDYRELKVFEKISNEAGYKKLFTALIEDYRKYVHERLGSDTEFNFWPIYWNENRHCGSNLFRRDQFIQLGGCCENFVSWGCWDADLQWKINEHFGIAYMPGEIIHLDHPKGYFDKITWQKDRELQEIRRSSGVTRCINEDKEVFRN